MKMCGTSNVLASDLLRGGKKQYGWAADRWLVAREGAAYSRSARRKRNGISRPGSRETNSVRHAGGGTERHQRHGVRLAGRARCPGNRADRSAQGLPRRDLGLRHSSLSLRRFTAGVSRRRCGPGRVEAFARAVGATSRLSFLGNQPKVEPYLRQAAVVWIPSRSGGGVCAALEAWPWESPSWPLACRS